jgi:hypothetical protein
LSVVALEVVAGYRDDVQKQTQMQAQPLAGEMVSPEVPFQQQQSPDVTLVAVGSAELARAAMCGQHLAVEATGADGVLSQHLCPQAQVAAGSAVAALAAVGEQHLAEEAERAVASSQLRDEVTGLAARLAEYLAWYEVAKNDESTAGREALAAELDDRWRAATGM